MKPFLDATNGPLGFLLGLALSFPLCWLLSLVSGRRLRRHHDQLLKCCVQLLEVIDRRKMAEGPANNSAGQCRDHGVRENFHPASSADAVANGKMEGGAK